MHKKTSRQISVEHLYGTSQAQYISFGKYRRESMQLQQQISQQKDILKLEVVCSFFY